MVAPFHLLGCSHVCVYKRDKLIAPQTASKSSSPLLPLYYCASTEWKEYHLYTKGFAKCYHRSVCVQSVSCEAASAPAESLKALGLTLQPSLMSIKCCQPHHQPGAHEIQSISEKPLVFSCFAESLEISPRMTAAMSVTGYMYSHVLCSESPR